MLILLASPQQQVLSHRPFVGGRGEATGRASQFLTQLQRNGDLVSSALVRYLTPSLNKYEAKVNVKGV